MNEWKTGQRRLSLTPHPGHPPSTIKQLARIEDARRVQDALDPAHHFNLRRAARAFQVALLHQADAVFGLVKKPYLSSTRSDAEIALMRGIKRVLDPAWLMNPGKLFDPE